MEIQVQRKSQGIQNFGNLGVGKSQGIEDNGNLGVEKSQGIENNENLDLEKNSRNTEQWKSRCREKVKEQKIKELFEIMMTTIQKYKNCFHGLYNCNLFVPSLVSLNELCCRG